MNVLTHLQDLANISNDIFLAVGVFDGLHLGHQAVLNQTINDAKAAGGTPIMLTFHPHPLKFLQPDRAPHLLTSTPHKQRLAKHYGMPFMLEVEFNQALAETLPETFIQQLVSSCCLRQICVGHQWVFGKNRAGNVDTLRQLGQIHHFAVVEIPQVLVKGKIVSSTRIRTAIAQGDFAEAEYCLGRPYTILGDVIHGASLGRSLGFPTANLSTHSEQFPPDGVYVVEAYHNDIPYPAVANIGNRPTITTPHPRRTLEVHLLNFEEDLYNQQLEIRFLKFLRTERQFPSLEALHEQIAIDVVTACKFFEQTKK